MFQSLHNLKLLKVKDVLISIHILFLEEDLVNLGFNDFNICGSCGMFLHKLQMLQGSSVQFSEITKYKP